jgi:hypothetical protein
MNFVDMTILEHIILLLITVLHSYDQQENVLTLASP